MSWVEDEFPSLNSDNQRKFAKRKSMDFSQPRRGKRGFVIARDERGFISSFREEKMFGFIAPLRNSENVFFHISEVMAEDPDYLPRQNDEVAFDIQEGRDGRLSAVNIDILPPGTIVVEEFSKQTFEGKIVDLPVLNKKSGLIEYESSENMPPKEIQFIDTDLHKDFKGHKFEVGDIIRFFTVHNLRTDQTYAAEIKIIKSREDIEREFLDMSLSSNPDKRRGIVTSVSDQGGKIQAIGEEQEIRFFPSFVQKDETKKKKSGDIRSRGLGLKVDDEVEFFLIKDTERYFNTKNGLVAVEVKKLPKGSVVSTMQISKRVFGRVIDAGSNSSGGRFFGKKQKHRKNGMVEVHLPQSLAEEYGISGGVVEKRIEPTEKINEPLVKAIVEYRAKDLDEPNMILCIGDLIAAELLLVQPFGDLIVSELKLYDFEGTYGFIEAINENRRSGELFGFIKTLDDRSIYFSERDLIDDTTLTVKFIEKQQKVPTKDDRHVIETPELVEGTHVCFKEISIEEQLAQQQNRFGGRGFDRDREDRDRDDGRAKRETKPKAVNVRLLPRGYIDTKKILFEDVEGVVVCVKEEKMVRVFNPTKSLLPLKPSFIGPSRADQNMVPDIVTVPSLPTGALLGSVVSISATAERDVAPRRGGFNRNFNRDNMHNNRRYNNNNNGNVEITTTLIQSQPLREVGRTVAAQGFILPYVSQKIHVDKFLNKHKQRHFSFVRGVANRMNGRLKWTVNSIKEAKVDISLFHEVQLNDDGTPAVFSGEVLDHDFSVKIWPQGMSPEDAPSATVKYMSKFLENVPLPPGTLIECNLCKEKPSRFKNEVSMNPSVGFACNIVIIKNTELKPLEGQITFVEYGNGGISYTVDEKHVDCVFESPYNPNLKNATAGAKTTFYLINVGRKRVVVCGVCEVVERKPRKRYVSRVAAGPSGKGFGHRCKMQQ